MDFERQTQILFKMRGQENVGIDLGREKEAKLRTGLSHGSCYHCHFHLASPSSLNLLAAAASNQASSEVLSSESVHVATAVGLEDQARRSAARRPPRPSNWVLFSSVNDVEETSDDGDSREKEAKLRTGLSHGSCYHCHFHLASPSSLNLLAAAASNQASSEVLSSESVHVATAVGLEDQACRSAARRPPRPSNWVLFSSVNDVEETSDDGDSFPPINEQH
nr:hypothetical protein Iba_chr02eCG2890 [Ipomoea batatas]